MQSYRLLAAVPLSEKDKPLIKEMEQTAFSAELTRAAEPRRTTGAITGFTRLLA